MVRYKIGKPQSLGGRFGQMAAVLFVVNSRTYYVASPADVLHFRSRHNVSREQLEKIATSIPKIAIITGDLDSLINHRCSYDLFEEMPVGRIHLIRA